jgi:hypothetical protein
VTASDAPELVGFARVAFSPPPLRELLTVRADGTASAWRSNGPVVGRFAGPADGIDALRAAVERAAAAGEPEPLELPPDAAWEEVRAAGRTGRFETDAPAPEPWTDLVDRCRALLDSLAASPEAAVAIVLDPDGRVRLEHRGGGTIVLELDSLQVSLTRWRDGREAGRAATPVPAGRVEAGPGWSLDVPDIPVGGDGGRLVAVATFLADDEGVVVPMAATGIVDAAG